ncbi:MAG: hypothetical protein JW993_19030 [Sedimentisphaerales bacterium]|nr:hypothetical protein [Sedimentisphaerales bacterium]
MSKRTDTARAILIAVTLLAVGRAALASVALAVSNTGKYTFDGTISREVLENYLDRSVTMAYFVVTGRPKGNRQYLYRVDDIRLIENIGAKFIGRAIYRWNGESLLNDPNFWTEAKKLMDQVHAFDPDVIFQGCLFETIHLQMPVSRMISCPNETFGSYRANTKSPACPIGYSQEETIKRIWQSDSD